MTTTNLDPCPKCGSQNVSIRNGPATYVYCRECRASTAHHRERASAIAAWNTGRQLTPEPLPTWDHYAEDHVDLPTDNGPDDIDFNPDEELIGKIARALASADGLIFDEVCGYDDPNGLDECDSSTCVSALYEDHDAEWARSVYWRTALNWIYPLILSEREAAKAPLKAEIAALRVRVSERADLELSYLARIAEMETALRPFAEHEDFHAPDDWCVTKYWSEDGETPGVTAGDFRRASAVFSKSGKPS